MPLGLALLGLLGALAPAGPDVMVSAAAPVDGQRLADALRAYFDGPPGDKQLRVELASPPPDGKDLRQDLAEARRLGQATRAIAVVRARPSSPPASGRDPGDPVTIEIEVLDLATDKMVLAAIRRPARDEDLYRALALKIHAVLRATLSEAPERVDPGSALGRIASPPAREVGPPGPVRAALDTGYALLSFPLARPTFHGLAVRASYLPRPWLDVSLGVAALGAEQDDVGPVLVLTRIIPLSAAARFRISRGRLEISAGPSAGLALVDVAASSDTVMVRSPRDLLVALGGEVEGRLRFGDAAWLFAGIGARGVVEGARYTVEGTRILDTSLLQLSAGAGVGVRLW